VTAALGSPAGDHRVLEPPGATPAAARRLDALGELRDGEVRVDLDALVLGDADLAAWRARLGTDPAVLSGALLETVAERGGLDGEPGRGTYLGTVAAVGAAHPWPASVGERVALPSPAVALPAFAVPGPWDGRSPVVPLRGHAVAPAGVPTVVVPDGASATAARWLALLADVPAALDALLSRLPRPSCGAVVVVLGGDTPAGAVASRDLVVRGVDVASVVETLEGARLAAGLGVGHVVVADLGDPVGTQRVIEEAVPATVPAAVVASAPAGPLAVRTAPRVLLLDGGSGAAVARHAAEEARAVEVLVRREPGAGRGERTRDLVASSRVLAEVLRWRTGHQVPRAGRHELPPWERT
jgi:L-erythro-3,5-diaminohexanoate dehydrogenase